MNEDTKEAIIKFLEKVKGKVGKELQMMVREGFVIDNLDDRWQKLAFTLYTDIAALSTEAEHILECLKGDMEI